MAMLSWATRWRMIGSSATPRSLARSISSSSVSDGDRGREAEAGPLVHERRDGHHPAVAHAADHVLVGHLGVLDEELVELGLAGDLAQRADLDRVLLHVHQEVGEALVLGHVAVAASHEHAPLRLVGEAWSRPSGR